MRRTKFATIAVAGVAALGATGAALAQGVDSPPTSSAPSSEASGADTPPRELQGPRSAADEKVTAGRKAGKAKSENRRPAKGAAGKGQKPTGAKSKKNRTAAAERPVGSGGLPASAKTPAAAKAYAKRFMSKEYGWGPDQQRALVALWTRESDWDYRATNPSSGAYGIPQSLPGNKMAAAGKDWRSNPRPQIRWGLDYIKQTYGTPVGAWGFFQANNWY